MKVYVCYEENYHFIAIEHGPVNIYNVRSTPDDAADWFMGLVASGMELGFRPDEEDKAVKDGKVERDYIVDCIVDRGFAALTMFSGYQDNFDESYAICVEKKDII